MPFTVADRAAAVSSGPPRHARSSGSAHGRRQRIAAGLTVVGALIITILSVVWLTTTSRPMSSGAAVGTSQQVSSAAAQPTGAQPTTDASAVPDGRSTTSVTKAGAQDAGAGTAAVAASIRLQEPAGPVAPFQAVPISGTAQGSPDSLLQVQRSVGSEWVSFPLPTRTDRSGQFATYVELGKPGRYWVRVLDPESGATSNRFLLVIKV